MIRLSCESLEAAIDSASSLLNRQPWDLERCLLNFPDDRLTPQQSNGWSDPDETLLREALGWIPRR
jgi:hypothetical protein